MVGTFVWVFASTFSFLINHPNNLNAAKRKSSVNSRLCHRALCSSSFMRMFPYCLKVLHFIVASESLRCEQFAWGGTWASAQIKRCCNCKGNTWSLLMMATENLCGGVQQHSSFHLCLAASWVVFYTYIDSKCDEGSWKDSLVKSNPWMS